MDQRTCAWCGGLMQGKRSNAIYCCKQHKVNAATARHRQRNPGYFTRYDNERGRKTPEQIKRVRAHGRKYMREYRLRNPEYGSQWWSQNTTRHAIYQAARRARKAGNRDSVGVSVRDWDRLVRRYGGCCAYCGVVADVHMDHVIPLKRGGRHAIGNVLPACQPCNQSKSARLLADWRYRR